jgi:recombination protein RecA
VAELARIQESVHEERSKTLRLSFDGMRTAAKVLEPAVESARIGGQDRIGRAPLWSHFRTGQLLELSGHAPGKLSTVVRLIARAQAEGEPVAWVGARDAAGFYPPDFALAGIDLASLVVVRMPVEPGSHALLRASEVLLRSGAFGLVVLDFPGEVTLPRGELSWQSRLSGLVRKHDARMVLLTGSAHDAPSLGPLIGLRVAPEAVQPTAHPGRVLLTPRVLKSKLGLSDIGAEAALSPDLRSLPVGAHWG